MEVGLGQQVEARRQAWLSRLVACETRLSRLVASRCLPPSLPSLSQPSLSLPLRPRNSTGKCCNKACAATKPGLQQRPPALSACALSACALTFCLLEKAKASVEAKARGGAKASCPGCLCSFILVPPSREQEWRGQEAQARRQACLEARDTRRKTPDERHQQEHEEAARRQACLCRLLASLPTPPCLRLVL